MLWSRHDVITLTLKMLSRSNWLFWFSQNKINCDTDFVIGGTPCCQYSCQISWNFVHLIEKLGPESRVCFFSISLWKLVNYFKVFLKSGLVGQSVCINLANSGSSPEWSLRDIRNSDVPKSAFVTAKVLDE